MAKSVRYSCINGQKPLLINKGHLVVTKATIIMINGGMDANRVSKPRMMSVPQIISNAPVKYAQKAGSLNPIFKKRSVPRSSGNRYFWIPSVRKTSPTTKRTNTVRLSFTLLTIKDVNQLVDFITALIILFVLLALKLS